MPTNECHKCGNFIEFPEHGVGEQIRCPHCGTPVFLTDRQKTIPQAPPLPEQAPFPKSPGSERTSESRQEDLVALAGLRPADPVDVQARRARRARRRLRRRLRLLVGGLIVVGGMGATIFVLQRSPRGPGGEVEHKAAVTRLQQDAAAAGAPAGLFGTKWLMSKKELLSVAPNAKRVAPDALSETRSLYDRPATVSYEFRDDLLLLTKVAFANPSSPAEYEQIQARLTADYGRMPRAAPAEGFTLSSQRKVNHFAVHHTLAETGGVMTEQILFYVRGANRSAVLPVGPNPVHPAK